MRIRSTPIAQPINAPTIGMSAVNAISTEISIAYGSPKIVIVTKNIRPKMQASRHCPEMNFEKVLLDRPST